ncbi:hypothetical protein AB3Z07_28270 (plasmid) [Metabacillus halosaccharovorans]|uniref:hypothetical protein n=1 Tax=Metabacillus halosaccharovorans TaxID=930124 RepID=UPI001C1FAAB5|nr:hypothetical protein [Metabacillus halosaccharovorans]
MTDGFRIADIVAYLINPENRNELESIVIGYASILNVDLEESQAIKQVLIQNLI